MVLTAMAAAIALPTLGANIAQASPPHHSQTTTPIKHLVVIFQENVSFDHYFGTYPNAANTSGQPVVAQPGTPAVNGLNTTLLTRNPNGVNPRRYDPANINDLLTCDQNHDYTAEQQAFDSGLMDKFVSSVGNGSGNSPTHQACKASDVMNYYDGNTVTALWNYAQNFAMSDNSFGSTYGPSSPGAINLVSGNTGTVDPSKEIRGVSKDMPNADVVTGTAKADTLTGDAQPYYDDCSNRNSVALTGQNVGDLLNAKGLSWGWFEGGFAPTTPYSGPGTPAGTYNPLNVTGRAACAAMHPIGAALHGTGQWGNKADYIPHHEPFQYYASSANPHHLAPTSLSVVGKDTQTYTNGQPNFDTANHNYDTSVFDQLVSAISKGNMSPDSLPAVSFLKAPGYQDGHAFYSDPIDEQQFIVKEINALQHTQDWSSTAVVISYDDSDGWYDHAFSGVTNPSMSAADALTKAPAGPAPAPGTCGNVTAVTPLGGIQGRCGFGPRLPLLVISPWARSNFVDSSLTSQTSIISFAEDNWGLPRIADSYDASTGSIASMFNFNSKQHGNGKLFLDPSTGQPDQHGDE
jgi:phospholipase C